MKVDGLDWEAMDRRTEEFADHVHGVIVRITELAALSVGGTMVAAAAGGAAASVDDLNSIDLAWLRELDAQDGVMAWVRKEYSYASHEQLTKLFSRLGYDPDKVPDFDVLSEAQSAKDYLREARNRLVGVGDNVWQDARKSLVEGMHAGEGIPALSKRVREVGGLGAERARMIARTEVVGASNAGSIAAMRASGQVHKKEWITTHDSRTRATHLSAGGQTVLLAERFTVGGSQLDHPGDPAGSAKEVVNCRCTMGYELIEDEPATLQSLVPQTPTPVSMPDPSLSPPVAEISPLANGDTIELRGKRYRVTRNTPGPTGMIEVRDSETNKLKYIRLTDAETAARVPAPTPTPKKAKTAKAETKALVSGPLTAQQYKAMIPEPGPFRKSRFESLRATLAETEKGKELLGTLDLFVDGSGVYPLRNTFGILRTGAAHNSYSLKLSAKARVLAEAINSFPPNSIPRVLHRGMAVDGTIAQLLAEYKVGAKFDWDLNSFTSDRNVAVEFADQTLDLKTQVPVRVELSGSGRHALPLQDLAPDYYHYQAEWLSGGQYEITGVTLVDDGLGVETLVLKVEQVTPINVGKATT